ncbi:TPA_asm: P6 [Glehnia littoralis virus 1]|uniref:P6 n=1 Tax=Glehnia littoralis virus 1 TaxID=2793728 RepID=A0A8D9PGS4_9RHAB|nr:P6 [Glehnia littoralis virus 1]DAF42326.1 TPA_asm: P6 [Glehnia littoralis virus 1]
MDFLTDKFIKDWKTDETTFDIPILGETNGSTLLYILVLLKVFIIITIMSCRASRRNRRLRLVAKWA